MPDFRCFCNPDSVNADSITLSREESLHLVSANRARIGDPVTAFDGNGTEWDTTLAEADKRKAVLRIGKSTKIEPPSHAIALAQALPKGKLIESIIRKATEIGIQRIHPIQTERTETKISLDRSKAKNAKWQTAAIEGAKQSGNPYLVEIAPLQDFDTFLKTAESYDLKLIASLTPQAVSLKEHMAKFNAATASNFSRISAIFLVGPEGDFTPRETEAALANGFLPTTLGSNVMRCETAATYALSILSHELA